MIRRPPRSTQSRSSAASDVYKRQPDKGPMLECLPNGSSTKTSCLRSSSIGFCAARRLDEHQMGGYMKAIYFLLKMNRLISSLRIKIAGVLAADILKLRHLFVRIDPVLSCNLRCEMCYYSDKAVRQSKRGQFSTDEIARIGGLFFKRTPVSYTHL